ncbi:uncharacterized protein LOC110853746 isoform X1 [Folsomia candida]|nr:uncharacterized protein LOC110853746 isoform X1 [Folsomia candida]
MFSGYAQEEEGDEEDEEDEVEEVEQISTMATTTTTTMRRPIPVKVPKPKMDFNIEGLDIEMINPDEDDEDDYQVVEDDEEEEYQQVYNNNGQYDQDQYYDEGDEAGAMGDGYYQNNENNPIESDESNEGGFVEQHSQVNQNNLLLNQLRNDDHFLVPPEMPREGRRKMEVRHPKFVGLNNMQLVSRMVQKGKIVNPAADDDDDEFLYVNAEQECYLAKKGVRVVPGKRNYQSRNGNDVFLSRSGNNVFYLGGGVPLEPVLAHPRLNDVVENFRQEMAYRKHVYKDKVVYKVDPSSIVPASVSGSAGSSSIGSEETDPEFLATDDESESEVINGSIAAWIVPDTGSRSPTPEYELEEPEYILTTAGSHSLEPPAKKRKQKHEPQPHTDGRIYPKPGFSYSCLIAMSLKNSKTGCLPVSEIYKFMCDHFPYFKTAPSGWKNSVRHNLSLNKCFEKIEKPGNGTRKGCLWALNPAKIHKMDEEVQKWSRKDPMSIRRAMSDPENLELLERGEMKKDYSGNGSDEDEEEEFGDGTTATIITTQAQRQSDQKIHIKKEDPLDFGTITNVRGNYLCAAPSGPQTYTLQFSNLSSTTPIIIRRTPVK